MPAQTNNSRLYYFESLGQVFIPKGTYNGQKLIKLVNTNTLASTNNTMPKAPEIILLKNKTAITAAIINLIILSAIPIFFLIMIALIFT